MPSHDHGPPHAVTAAAAGGGAALPPGWITIQDPHGRTYYGNPVTGDTSWDPPSLPPPPLPPPVAVPPPQLQHESASVHLLPGPAAAFCASVLPQTSSHLIPQIRSMMDAEQSSRMQALAGAAAAAQCELELPDLTAGTLADLCNIRRENNNMQSTTSDPENENSTECNVVPYEPLEPHSMDAFARPPHVEPGRVEIRMLSLYDKLQQLKYQ
mmetsp:Transcript_3645/g.8273  ORF Transcript_3645/g.8273 Transcript_3645/m.8273 type:complete len:212 (-) Transcript_3645:157-792(-)|eukprot:CAMPEP_0178503924 /NCGR_PEP_ID=MMETSP0696-20121128/18308_1 /TAXON_ID=265572 /ORGANISM="Extubocellulus spinifer, Strain CCMP396" /LENGTH=211 /DNA_ID=CAMNT_0020133103 /DNA_START=61 /DNA_END=696 /DNA_ORIENTATION=+